MFWYIILYILKSELGIRLSFNLFFKSISDTSARTVLKNLYEILKNPLEFKNSKDLSIICPKYAKLTTDTWCTMQEYPSFSKTSVEYTKQPSIPESFPYQSQLPFSPFSQSSTVFSGLKKQLRIQFGKWKKYFFKVFKISSLFSLISKNFNFSFFFASFFINKFCSLWIERLFKLSLIELFSDKTTLGLWTPGVKISFTLSSISSIISIFSPNSDWIVDLRE